MELDGTPGCPTVGTVVGATLGTHNDARLGSMEGGSLGVKLGRVDGANFG